MCIRDRDEAYYLDVDIDDGEPIPQYTVASYKFDKKGKLTRSYLASDYYWGDLEWQDTTKEQFKHWKQL